MRGGAFTAFTKMIENKRWAEVLVVVGCGTQSGTFTELLWNIYDAVEDCRKGNEAHGKKNMRVDFV